MKKGFTLVELSIVLVIIGLLIGGILVAQSMIGTAKIQALARQIGQFDAAVENFVTKYNQLPGDTNLMGAIPGNNDGFIRDSNGGYSTSGGEFGKFWSDLSVSGLSNPNGSYTDNSEDYSGVNSPTIYLPKAVAGEDAYFTAFTSNVAGMNYFLIAKNGAGYGAYTPAEVLALDTKMDDGLPDRGELKPTDTNSPTDILDPNGDTTLGSGDVTYGNFCAGTSYLVAPPENIRTFLETDRVCNIRVRMGLSTGNLK